MRIVSRAFGTARRVYLDSLATNRVDPRVLEAMLPYSTQIYGNPHSKSHCFGWKAEQGVQRARARVSSLVNASPKEIIFTSGATESNNIAIKGVARFYRSPQKRHVITLQTEHKCVLDSMRALEEQGFEVTYLPVELDGRLDLALLKETLEAKPTILVSIMAANNEIGVLQDVAAIGQLCRKNGAFFHSDCAQAVGKISLDVQAMQIDLMSISGHKIYGPKGVGALYVRRSPRVKLHPLFNGGGQERGLRSGTVAPWLVVGLGKACQIAQESIEFDNDHIKRLESKLIAAISKIEHVKINGSVEHKLPGTVNFSVAAVEGESLMMALSQYALSSGSACTSASLQPSYVLRALKVQPQLAHTSIRVGINKFTREAEVDQFINSLMTSVEQLREMSPLWEMMKEGVDLKSIKWSDH